MRPPNSLHLKAATYRPNSATAAGIARSAATGESRFSVDKSFDPPGGVDNEVTSSAIQPDGRIVLAGHFGMVGGIARRSLARLNPDGSVDTTFDPGPAPDESATIVVVQPDGKIIAGGAFTTFGGSYHSHIVRLNAGEFVDLPPTILRSSQTLSAQRRVASRSALGRLEAPLDHTLVSPRALSRRSLQCSPFA